MSLISGSVLLLILLELPVRSDNTSSVLTIKHRICSRVTLKIEGIGTAPNTHQRLTNTMCFLQPAGRSSSPPATYIFEDVIHNLRYLRLSGGLMQIRTRGRRQPRVLHNNKKSAAVTWSLLPEKR